MANETLRPTLRIKDELMKDIDNIANEQNTSRTKVVEDALKLYRDYYHMENKATVINEDILKLSKSSMDLLEHRINNKTNQVLSELAIQESILVQLIAQAYKFNPSMLDDMRKKAVQFLKINNRVMKLSEIYVDNDNQIYDDEDE